MRGQLVGVELTHVDLGRARLLEHPDLLGQPVGAAGSEHDSRARRQQLREFHPDLAAATENHDGSPARVIHGCDYVLR